MDLGSLRSEGSEAGAATLATVTSDLPSRVLKAGLRGRLRTSISWASVRRNEQAWSCSSCLEMHQHPAPQLPLDRAVADDLIDVLEACGSHPQQAQWRHIWELASASYLDRQHRVLWWRLLHGSLMCGAYRAYIGRATPAQANCPFSCCIDPSQPQTISHLFITCPVAATVTDWLCRLWQAMTGYLPVVSAASLLAADTPSEQLPSDALLRTWHRLRLAVLHSIWAASQNAQATRSTQPSDASAFSRSLFGHKPGSFGTFII